MTQNGDRSAEPDDEMLPAYTVHERSGGFVLTRLKLIIICISLRIVIILYMNIFSYIARIALECG